MLKAILGFELRQQFGNPVFWVVAAVFALLGFGASSSDAVQVGGGIGNVMRNAPYVIVGMLNVFTVISMLLVTIFIGAGALRDFDNRTAELFFATPVKKRDYLAGRFAGGYIAAAAVLLAAMLGMVLGYGMPWVDAARLGPWSAAPYAWSLCVVILPNLLFVGALLFCLAVASRSMLATYLGVIAFFTLSVITGTLTADLDTRWIGAMLDPFGSAAIEEATRYWSSSERNTLLPPLSGLLLANRAAWMAVGAALLVLTYRLFRTDREGLRLRRRKRATAMSPASTIPTGTLHAPAVALQTGIGAQWRQFLHQAWFDTRGVLTGVPLLVMLAIGLFMLVTTLVFGDQLFGTALYPTTIRMSQLITGSFSIFLVIIVTFYAGELAWRERQQGVADVTDAYPNADWVPMAAKLVALTAVVLLFYTAGIATTVVTQLVSGYTRLQPGLYLSQMLIGCAGFVLMGVLALFLQVLTNNKFVAYLLMVVYLIARVVLGILDFDDNLYRPFGAPSALYSDMNGYGHFLAGHLWFRAYWGAFAGLLFAVALLFWVRGHRTTWPERMREARRRFSAGPKLATAVLALLFVGLGVFLFRNTHLLNTYEPGDLAEQRAAEYEKAYRQYKDLPQPRILAMRTEVDLRPETLELQVRGHYRLANRSTMPIETFHVEWWDELEMQSLDFAEHVEESDGKDLGHHVYRLAKPMQPGEEMDFGFAVAYRPRGVRNDPGPTQIVENGTFFTNAALPQFGYDESRQLVDRNDRRKYGLGEVPRMPKLGDEAARANTYISDDADWIDFDTTISTAPDQIALAPGYLQRAWNENGRRYFHYRMDVPMLPFAAWLSARWAVKKSDWNGMPIEVYYHPEHDWNVDRMIEAAKKSFDYYNAHFTPYQHRQLRILEFPGYSQYAQSFANTVPYSESIGFVADLRDPDAIDYVFYVTAHEVAHQWWAHRVIGADMQGSTLLSESLSQYSALMVMEKEYGAHKMRRFLRYELDNYLRARALEPVEELPLAKVENQQYIHYRKGSLVFYALKDAIGEDALNAVLKRFLEDKGFQQPPYTTSAEFLDYLRTGTDPKHRRLIEDLFEKIVFFDNRVTAVTAKKREDGKYVVALDVHAGKLEAAGKGEESAVALDDEIDIGVFARPAGGEEADEKVLYLAKHRITQADSRIEVVVDERPYDAGIDPLNKLIDRVPADNRRTVAMD
jgi:ABC-2 type transport system permease protein